MVDAKSLQNKAFVAYGSNRGPRQFLYDWVFKQFKLNPALKDIRRSSLYETVPVAENRQPFYLNGVISAETELSCAALFEFIRSLEQKAGRVRLFDQSERSLDLDFLFLGHQNFSSHNLEIPHPRILDRAFVLIPLAEIDPGFRHESFEGCLDDLVLKFPKEELQKVRLFRAYGDEED